VHDPWEGVSPAGSIVTGARRDRVPADFEPVLAAARDRVSSRDEQASLYLYGSVATGQARVPTSDVDLFTIDLGADVATTIGRDLSRQFSRLCRAVDIGAASANDYAGGTDAAYGNRVFLRHYSVHLAGPPRHESGRDYPADIRAARGFNGDIALHADRWRRRLDAGGDHVELARGLARKSLLAVAGLVSIHDGTWTTDRVGSARRWAQLAPDLGRDLDALVTWIDGEELPDRAEVDRILDGLVAELVRSFASTIGLWR
jgi:uncharacterized protein